MKVRIARTDIVDGLEGPGVRLAIWVQGCSIGCENCCNPGLIPGLGGTLMDTKEIEDLIKSHVGKVEGISILGGEPLDQPDGTLEIAKIAKELGLGVILFSGYPLKVIEKSDLKSPVLNYVDLLIDGPYVESLRETTRRWVGSSNQGMRFLTDRYNKDDQEFKQENKIEFILKDDELIITGFPIDIENEMFFEELD